MLTHNAASVYLYVVLTCMFVIYYGDGNHLCSDCHAEWIGAKMLKESNFLSTLKVTENWVTKCELSMHTPSLLLWTVTHPVLFSYKSRHIGMEVNDAWKIQLLQAHGCQLHQVWQCSRFLKAAVLRIKNRVSIPYPRVQLKRSSCIEQFSYYFEQHVGV